MYILVGLILVLQIVQSIALLEILSALRNM